MPTVGSVRRGLYEPRCRSTPTNAPSLFGVPFTLVVVVLFAVVFSRSSLVTVCVRERTCGCVRERVCG